MKTNNEKNLSDGRSEDESTELKYTMCKYCKGAIPKHSRKMAIQTHCAKHCSETNKMVSSGLEVTNGHHCGGENRIG